MEADRVTPIAVISRTLPSRWSGAVLVCAKCSKKLDGGFGPKRRTSLAKALRKRFGLKKGRKAAVGVVEVRCLGVCPKNAVTLIDTAQPDCWRIVGAGADIVALGRSLGLDQVKSARAELVEARRSTSGTA